MITALFWILLAMVVLDIVLHLEHISLMSELKHSVASMEAKLKYSVTNMEAKLKAKLEDKP